MKCPYCENEFDDREDRIDHIRNDHENEIEECGCCGCYHPKTYFGDCRDDNNRF